MDTVVRQSPPPNMRVKTGQNAHVVLSLGPQKVTIPQLNDRSLRAAQIELLRGGMQVGEISSVYLPRLRSRHGDPAGSRAGHVGRHQPARELARFARAAPGGVRDAGACQACRLAEAQAETGSSRA